MTDPEDIGVSTGFYTESEDVKELVAEFDETFADTQPGHNYSRSQAIHAALRLAIDVEESVPEEWGMDERGKRTFVRQAILNEVRSQERDDTSR